ncbi:hypothetical protein C8R47DRAFT_379393 [Mycena vitilis]|nr:hypothetical protein C8R47DRAFT_379393 [Mycena vitilis]
MAEPPRFLRKHGCKYLWLSPRHCCLGGRTTAQLHPSQTSTTPHMAAHDETVHTKNSGAREHARIIQISANYALLSSVSTMAALHWLFAGVYYICFNLNRPFGDILPSLASGPTSSNYLVRHHMFFWVTGYGLRVSVFWCPVSGFWLLVSGFGSGVSCLTASTK